MSETPNSGGGDAKEQPVPIAVPILISVVTLVVAVLKSAQPEWKIDEVTLGLVALSILPWLGRLLAPWFKSVRLPGGIELTLQEQLQKAQGAAESASRKADLALANPPAAEEASSKDGTEPALASVSPTSREAIKKLVAEYDEIREQEPSGDLRTRKMTCVVKAMMQHGSRLSENDIEELLAADERGNRLAAYAALYAQPRPNLLPALVDTVITRGVEGDRPFGQYWGILAIGSALPKAAPSVGADIRRKLVTLLTTLPPDSDRHYELSKILQQRTPRE